MGEPFIISIDNIEKAVTVIEFFADGNLKSVTHSNRFNAAAVASSSALDISQRNFRVFELYENGDEDSLAEEETKVATAIAGVRYFDDKNFIIEQSPKYMFSNGLFHKAIKIDTKFTAINNAEQITAYIPWHLIHLKNVGADQIEVDVYLSDKKITSLKEEIYVDTLVNKNLFKISYTNSFFSTADSTFAYGLHNFLFENIILKVAKEIGTAAESLNIVSQQDFINYNTAFINQQNNLPDLKTNLENVIEQNKFYDQKGIVSCNQDVLNLFKNGILDTPKVCSGHEALHFLLNAQVINLDKDEYKLVSVWKDFEYVENMYSPELSMELLDDLIHHYASNVDNQGLVSNYIAYNQPGSDDPVVENSIGFEDVNNFFVDIEQNMNSYYNTSLESS